jgi:biopolymer transport protein ExbD
VRYAALDSAGERIPNLAPMVDVIMVLLIFFLLGASLNLSREGSLATELDPRSGPGGGAAVEIIPAVKIALEDVGDGAACRLYVNGQPVEANTFAALRNFMAQRRDLGADTSNPVVIGAQAGVRWRYVVKAMDAAVGAGFTNVQFAVSLTGSSE